MSRRLVDRLVSGDIDPTTNLTRIPGIGEYLEERLARALRRARPLTVGSVQRALRGRTREQVLDVLHRALQNRRANQCVGRSPDGPAVYHAGDVNERGYEAIAAILEAARRTDRVAYTRLPAKLPKRSVASQRCGCRTVGECGRDTLCRVVDGVCVPRHARARGFESAMTIPNQREKAAHHRSVRRRSKIRTGRDLDAIADHRAGHASRLEYVRAGDALWRRPSPRVRVPI